MSKTWAGLVGAVLFVGWAGTHLIGGSAPGNRVRGRGWTMWVEVCGGEPWIGV